MYPGKSAGSLTTGPSGNHKKGCCSDGAMQLLKDNEQNRDPPKPEDDTSTPRSFAPPDWPQPQGIFTDGNKFHPYVFLEKINEMYEKVVVDREGADFSLEHASFAALLTRRTVIRGGAVLFKLFTTRSVPAVPDALIVVIDNNKHIQIDSLRESESASGSS